MSRQTPTSKRSPSILVTDVRNAPSGGRSAPFVKLKNVSVDALLSGTSEVPSAQQRRPVRQQRTNPRTGEPTRAVSGRAPPRLTQNVPSRSSKTLQRLVLIPSQEDGVPGAGMVDTDDEFAADENRAAGGAAMKTSARKPTTRLDLTDGEQLPKEKRDGRYPRVTSYFVADGFRLKAVADYIRHQHKARTRLYDEALFVDYLLPLLPGNGTTARVQSSPGDSRSMERMIDISEQGDYHYEYFSGQEASTSAAGPTDPEEFDPSEPQDFSPQPRTFDIRRRISSNGSAEQSEHRHNDHNDPQETPERVVTSGAEHDEYIPDPNRNEIMSNPSSPNGLNPAPLIPEAGVAPVEGTQVTDLMAVAVPNEEEPETAADARTPEQSQSAEQAVGSPPIAHAETGHYSPPRPTADHASGGHKEEGSRSEPTRATRRADVDRFLTHAALFVLNYGVLVFWNLTEAQEKAIIADLTIGHRNLAIRPFSDNIETEAFNFRFSDDASGKPRIFNDMITLTSPSHMIKLSLSHAIAQSTKLSRFEDRMQANMHDVKYVPKTLALTGKLGLTRSQVLQISGKLFKLRVDVNLSSNILDTPEFFWESEPSLNPLYSSMREYLEIEQRILVLNERCLVFLEFTGILADSIAEGNMGRITVIVILLIVMSICVSLAEIAVRFIIVKRLHK